MAKSPDAFRTISEVADWLGVQAHVLRFWESKFAQVKPIKRAGGRRYYRPADMLLIGGIKKLLHDDGLTIKGAQKLLREKGVAYVADLSQPLDELTMAVIDGQLGAAGETAERRVEAAQADAAPEPAAALPEEVQVEEARAEDARAEADLAPAFAHAEADRAEADDVSAGDGAPLQAEPDPPAVDAVEEDAPAAPAPAEEIPEAEDLGPMPAFRARPRPSAPPEDAELAPVQEDVQEDAPEPSDAADPDLIAEAETVPETLAEATQEAEPPAPAQEAAEEETPAAPRRPRPVKLPPMPPLSEIAVDPSVLTALARVRRMSPELAREIKPIAARLNRFRAGLASALEDGRKD